MSKKSEVFTVMTYNLWKTNGAPTAWDVRAPIVKRQLQKLKPDVLLVQELHPEVSSCTFLVFKSLMNLSPPYASDLKNNPTSIAYTQTRRDEHRESAWVG